MDKRSQEAEQRLSVDLPRIGFDYLGGYTNKYSIVRIRCRLCGTEYERTYYHIKNQNLICVECQKQETQRKKNAQKEAERLERLHHKEAQLTRKEVLLSRTGICEICGKPYTVRDYVESCGLKYASDGGVCSADCKKEKLRKLIRESHKGRRDDHRHRAKKNGCEYDSSVTLKKLIKRDGLRCALCGGMCDMEDHSWSRYSGPMYPSIDHIIPMSKGGGHVWDNVQIAHIICNSMKGDMGKGVLMND